MNSSTRPAPGGNWTLGDLAVTRIGYGAMQLAGPGVMGPPADREGALAVLREVVALGVTHIDTSAAYGPGVTNQLIREALHPYPAQLHVVTKVGARRDPDGGWPAARRPDDLRRAVEENLQALGVDRLDVVNLRVGDAMGTVAESVEEAMRTLDDLRGQGLIRHLGISNALPEQIAQARSIAPIVCVQNMYNLAFRGDDDLIAALAEDGIAYVPFFPLGGFSPLQAQALSSVAGRHGVSVTAVALAWLLQRSPNILLIPGTSSLTHLRENVAAADLELSAEDVVQLDAIGRA